MSFRTQSNNSQETDKKRQFEHYVHLFRHHVWFILPVMAVVITGYFLALNKLGLSKPQLQATAILHFDDPANLSAVEERVSFGTETKGILIKSRSFLESVVSTLSLQLRVSRYPRSMLFDSVSVQIDAPVGNYKLLLDANFYKLIYTDRSKQSTVIQKGKVSSLETTSLPGITLYWTKEFKKKPHNIRFQITRMRDAVDLILNNMEIKTVGKEGSVLSVSILGRDYEMIASIANTIADNFVKENTVTKQSRKNDVIEILNKQLETARNDMIGSAASLRKYREANPTVGLSDAFSPPVALLDLRETEAELKSAHFQAQGLNSRYTGIDDSSRSALLAEMISFLNKYQTGTATALQMEHDLLTEENRRLASSYAPNHPLILKSRATIQSFGAKVTNALTDLMEQLQRKIGENNTRIYKINSQISALPAKEIHLSNLRTRYDISTEIYSNVLTRYNEAIIARAVAIGDIFVVDHAVVPEQPVNVKTFFAFIIIGLLFGAVAGIGPVVIRDSFDKTARNEKDLRRLTNLSILESIPIKGDWKTSVPYKTFDKKLVAADHMQNFVDESYRSLRAKILLSLHNEKNKRILVTSLGIGEGKSFTAANIAITLAQQQIRTLLIDGDLRRGIQHVNFGLNKKPGLTSILTETLPLDITQMQHFFQKTHINNLTVLGSGGAIHNSAEILNSLKFRELLQLLSGEFEAIILDTPPVAVTTDAIGIQDAFHKYIFVVKAAHTNITELNRKIREFPGLNKKVMGIVLNGAPYKQTEYYQYSSYKYVLD